MTDLGAAVRRFLKGKRLVCYGGQAINDLLPPEARFYGPDDTPDYDCFCENPQLECIHLVDFLRAAGLDNVRARFALHLATFRVWVDATVVADFTRVPPTVFANLWRDRVVRAGVAYANPNFLRMTVYLELSRPKGFVERWDKITPRLALLNAHWPLSPTAPPGTATRRLDDARIPAVLEFLKGARCVLLGVTAVRLPRSDDVWTLPIDAISDRAAELVDGFRDALGAATAKRVTADSDILPDWFDCRDAGGRLLGRLYTTNACHSYHNTRSGLRVASVPTMLHWYFASLYLRDESPAERDRVQTLCAELMRIAASAPRRRRFTVLTPSTCIGTQLQVPDAKKQRKDLWQTFSDKKLGPDFLRYSFFYDPARLDAHKRAALVRKVTQLYK